MKKYTKAEVKFESPHKGPHMCSECVHFDSDTSSCKIVEGYIKPSDWCEKFKAKRSFSILVRGKNG